MTTLQNAVAGNEPPLPGGELIVAVLRNDFRLVKKLLESGIHPDSKNPYGTAAIPLGLAVDRGNLQLIELLLDHGADIDRRDGIGLNAVTRAAANNKVDILKLLISRNADVDTPDRNGLTPLQHAEYGKKAEAAEILREASAERKRGAAEKAAKEQHDREMTELIEQNQALLKGNSRKKFRINRP